MCGIIGCVTNNEDVLSILVPSLERLQYRGHDSAGLVVFSDGGAQVRKAIGKQQELQKVISRNGGLNGFSGFAHTRWATNGAVTVDNAHPHSCGGKIFVVHNGRIGRYAELKQVLIEKGHQFTSDTDSEVIAHLIGDAYNDGQVSFENAVRIALRSIPEDISTYGLIAMSTDEPHKMIAARHFSPLLIGIAGDMHFVASDAAAVRRHTDQVIDLHDGEIAIVTPESYVIHNKSWVPVSKEIRLIEWSDQQAQKNGYKFYMRKEIEEQPDAIRAATKGRYIEGEGKANLGGLMREILINDHPFDVDKLLLQAERLVLVGCGTSYYAARMARWMLEKYTGLLIDIIDASQFRYRSMPLRKGKDVVIVISQSGETADTRDAMYDAKGRGVLVLGIVNVTDSTIARETDAGVYLHIGPEIGVASSKACLAQLMVMTIIALLLGERNMTRAERLQFTQAIEGLPSLLERALELSQEIEFLAPQIDKYENIYFLGQGSNADVAGELALKYKEITYAHAEAYAGSAMDHGPLALIDENFLVVAVVPQDETYEDMIGSIEVVRASRGKVIAIATVGDDRIADFADYVLYVPRAKLDIFNMFALLVVGQLLAYHVADSRGNDVDNPRRLAKSVTV